MISWSFHPFHATGDRESCLHRLKSDTQGIANPSNTEIEEERNKDAQIYFRVRKGIQSTKTKKNNGVVW